MTTGELLRMRSTVSDTTALLHLRNLAVTQQYVDYAVAELYEDTYKAEIIDTLESAEVIRVFEATLVEEKLAIIASEEIIKGALQC